MPLSRKPQREFDRWQELKDSIRVTMDVEASAEALIRGFVDRISQLAKNTTVDDRSGHEKAEEELALLEASAGTDL